MELDTPEKIKNCREAMTAINYVTVDGGEKRFKYKGIEYIARCARYPQASQVRILSVETDITEKKYKADLEIARQEVDSWFK